MLDFSWGALHRHPERRRHCEHFLAKFAAHPAINADEVRRIWGAYRYQNIHTENVLVMISLGAIFEEFGLVD